MMAMPSSPHETGTDIEIPRGFALRGARRPLASEMSGNMAEMELGRTFLLNPTKKAMTRIASRCTDKAAALLSP